MSVWENLFGSSLQSKSGDLSTNSALEGKFVGIYFSAHWCPPCRGFTPALAKFYNDFKAKASVDAQFEIVFVSSDKDPGSFNEYYGQMPWLALPFAEREKKANLSRKFKVEGIPTLVILATDGSVITKHGTEKVQQDSRGLNFPWVPLSLSQELGETFVSKTGTVSASSFAGKYLGIYFSAHWCPPCRKFTPVLASFYNKRRASGQNDFEIVYASGDKSPAQFSEYYETMPWLALPHGDPRIAALNNRFGVEGIPTLVIVGPDWEVISTSAVSAVMADKDGSKFPYHPQPIVDLSEGPESYGFDINSKPSLVVFMENQDDGDQADIQQALMPTANAMARDKAKSEDGPDMLFFTCCSPGGIGGQIRTICQLGDVRTASDPVMVILDISDNGAYYEDDSAEINATTIAAFIEGFQNKTLERKQMSRS